MRQYGATRLFCSGNMGQQRETNNWFSQNPRQSEQINLWLKWSNVASLFILPYFPFSGATQIFEVREPKTKFYLVLIFPIRMKHPWEFLGIDKLQSGSKCKQIIGCPTFHIAPYFEVGLQENQKEMEQCCSTFHIAPYCPTLSLKYSRDTCHQVITTGAMWWVMWCDEVNPMSQPPPRLCHSSDTRHPSSGTGQGQFHYTPSQCTMWTHVDNTRIPHIETRRMLSPRSVKVCQALDPLK